MKIKISCEIEADIVDKEEIEAIKERLDGNKPMRFIKEFWKKDIREALKKLFPYPTYDNQKFDVKVEYIDKQNEQTENDYAILVPCKTKEIIWFIDDCDYLGWAKVIAFTEKYIIADSPFTENRINKEKLLISEWNKTIVKADSREEAENKLIKLGFVKFKDSTFRKEI